MKYFQEFEYKYASKRWVTHDDFHSITSFEDTLFFLLPHDKRDNAFQQVASLRLSHGQLRTPKFLNLGEYDVTSINGINKETRTIFFHAAAPKPSHRSLFSYSLADESRNSAYCISCSIKNCTWAQAQMDDQMKTAIVSCKGPAAPHTAIVNLTRMDSDKKTERRLQISQQRKNSSSYRCESPLRQNLSKSCRRSWSSGDYQRDYQNF